MVKTTFLQDLKQQDKWKDSNFGFFVRDRLETSIDMLIKRLRKEIARLNRLSEKKDLCKDEKEGILAYLGERKNKLADKIAELKRLKQKIFEKGNNQEDIEKEIDSILNASF